MKKVAKKCLSYLIWKAIRIKTFFERDAFVQVGYYYENGEKKPDSFNFYVCQWGKCWSLFRSIAWEDAEQALKALEKHKGKMTLSVGVGMGTSALTIPNWARKKLVKELRREIEKHDRTNETTVQKEVSKIIP